MKGSWKNKIIAGLTSALVFFGSNVYATEEKIEFSQKITPGRIGAIVGIVCILIVLGVVYKIDENHENSMDIEPMKKEKTPKGASQVNSFANVDETIIPYERETNEQYIPDNIEPVISGDDEAYEDNTLYQEPIQDMNFDENEDIGFDQGFNSDLDFGEADDQQNVDEDNGLSNRIDELDDIEDADSEIGKFSEKNTYNNNLNSMPNNQEVQNSFDNTPLQNSDNDSLGFSTDLNSSQEDETIEDFDEGSGEYVDLPELDELDDIEGAEEVEIPNKPIEDEIPNKSIETHEPNEETVQDSSDEFQGFSLASDESEETADDFAGFSTEESSDNYNFQGFEGFASQEEETNTEDLANTVNTEGQNKSEDTKTEDDIDNFFLSQMEETMKKSQNFDTNDAVPEKTQEAKTTKAPKTTKTTKATKTTTTTKRITKKKTDK